MARRRSNYPLNKTVMPFNPATGKFTGLAPERVRGIGMMQVIEADTHDNYVVCRGYDPEDKLFYLSIPVAKPYGERGTTGTYQVGEVHAACKPKTGLGDTSMARASGTGHPADLDEVPVILRDDNGVAVSWLMLTAGTGGGYITAHLTATLSAGSSATADAGYWDDGGSFVSYGWSAVTVIDKHLSTGQSIASGKYVEARRLPMGNYLLDLASCGDITEA